MTPTATSPMISVLDGGRICVGHLLRRGPAGVEAFDRNDHSLGIFSDADRAAAAIWRAAHDQMQPITSDQTKEIS
jgi:hypothetical protein